MNWLNWLNWLTIGVTLSLVGFVLYLAVVVWPRCYKSTVGSMGLTLVMSAGLACMIKAGLPRETSLTKPSVAQVSVAKASVAAPDVGGEFTNEYARLNGIDCPVYRRENGTYFAIAGAERLDVDRVEGHTRRDGTVRPYYRTRRDGAATNNLSANLHRGDE